MRSLREVGEMMKTRLERLQDLLDWLSLTNPDHSACVGERGRWDFEDRALHGYTHGIKLWEKKEPEAVEVWWLAGSEGEQGFTKTVIVNQRFKQIQDATAEELWHLGARPSIMLAAVKAAANRARGVALQSLFDCAGAERTACDQLSFDHRNTPSDAIERVFDVLDGLRPGTTIEIRMIYRESGDTQEVLKQKSAWLKDAMINICWADVGKAISILESRGADLYGPHAAKGSKRDVVLCEGFDPRAFAEECGRGICDITIK